MTEPKTAAAITKASKSNLALAFVALPPERRADITEFYAFCRLVDDIADAPDLPVDEKRRRIHLWRESIADTFAGEPPLAAPLRELIRKYMIQRSLFVDILDGVEMDLEPRRYETFEDLRAYCYRVASAVGLVSIEIFGYRNVACKEYAVDLGMALQLTNILRDVREDWENGHRVYLPMEDLSRFNYTPEDIAARTHDDRFLRLMNFEAVRALSFYKKAAAELPPEDRRSMTPARIMAEVYGRILRKMRTEGFRVYEKRYRLGTLGKAAIVSRLSLFSMFMR
ncbi:MAG TPA: presqualene diphosphate synthase HpnD [Chthoniobacteraceae bacterium]|jgi:phytoene synthase|nr:presqualene diphosphate synthase HpnD [Chthoniobacteraceae bacterium]